MDWITEEREPIEKEKTKTPKDMMMMQRIFSRMVPAAMSP
jgi:hypothetical protein